MKFYLIDEHGADVVDIANTNEAINKALHWKNSWGCWNETAVDVSGIQYLIICCDLGKRIGLPISAIPTETFETGKLQEPFMVGPVLITKFDGKDDYETLTEKDIENLRKHTGRLKNPISCYKEVLIINN